jgi:hypothetical protein
MTGIRAILPEFVVDQAQLIHDPTILIQSDEKSVAASKCVVTIVTHCRDNFCQN